MDNILEISGLNKHFGKKIALDNVGFNIKKGHIVGLVGPNGAGKSTIMKAVLGLIGTDSGQIKVEDELISINNHPALEKVGALIEYPGIYPYMTGREHLKLYATGANAESNIDQIVEELEMTKYIQMKAKSYSLGMKQKLGIALALVNKPEFVILDEPMNGLDPQANKLLRELIVKQAKAGTTFLISSHILSELGKIADDIVVIEQGKIIADAPIDEITHADKKLIILETSDDNKARQILKENNYAVADENKVIIQQNKEVTLAKILRLLVESVIDINDVKHQNAVLEDSLLQILKDDEK
ncbi:ATP-binding cassette domain-containing protein [Lactobacillus salsicarnum]|uniref:ATP-binding cassette domain-containing protein n=1 Tax=Companilactobacillus mishanensis TaxID=2486008 RepID=A0A5P0ZGC6_9LACO|nr:ATP-binding cassette domain-containing protein [Companilactobacillus mishanensis]MQS52035.1 ATP-binding cassette domain-containing protein [Companilactobacillus mishanensis]